MIDAALLAFAIGVKSTSAGRAFVFVRDAGPPVPFELKLKQRPSRKAPWVDVEGVSYFPARPKTTKTGRRVTLVLPDNLERFVQVCAITPPSYQSLLQRRSINELKDKPKAKEQQSSGLSAQLNLRVMSCVNLRPLNMEQGLTS